jgi:hypothetical protein
VGAKKWLLGRDRFTHLNLLNFIRNDSPEDYENYLIMSDENVRYSIAIVKPLIAKQDTVMRNAITPEAASRAPPKALTIQARIGQVRLVTLHTQMSLTHWNPSPAGLASQTCTCMGTLCPSVSMYQRPLTSHIFMKFNTGDFHEDLSTRSQFGSNLTNIPSN